MTEFNKIEIERSHELGLIEEQLKPGGFLFDIASAKVKGLSIEATPEEVSFIIIPGLKDGKPAEIRFELVDKANADQAVKEATVTNSPRIMDFANRIGLRRIVDGVRQPEDIDLIDPVTAIFCVEGGANKTSVVRRGVAIEAMHETYGDDLSNKVLYQFGSDRRIKNDSEISTIRELAGDNLPEGEFDEFDANVATARADGYELVATEGSSLFLNMVSQDISKPHLCMVKTTQEGGFKEGLSQVAVDMPSEVQIVISTNGQYREKAKVLTEAFGRQTGVDFSRTVALGDEPGDEFSFAGGIVKVPARPESAYTNDIALLYRLMSELV
jgi:hypothetical protein